MAVAEIVETIQKDKIKLEPCEASSSHEASPKIHLVQKEKTVQHNQQDWLVVYDEPVGRNAHLPPLDWESGYREVYDEQSGKVIRTPITLFDIIYPLEEDLGVVKVAQGVDHSDWITELKVIIQSYLEEDQAEEEWLVLQDVIIYWEDPESGPRSPDITAIPGGKRPKPPGESYRVGRQGPVPSFVVEITSRETRKTDLNTKPEEYASHGIQEYLIIDIRTPVSKDWKLIGYVLDQDNTTYHRLIPDEEGGVTFENLPLRFVPIGREYIEVYNAQTGERLLNLSKMRQFAKSETKRADTEAERAKSETKRADAEAERADAEAERAKSEAERAKSEAERAKSEASARKALEEELALLRAQLEQKET